MDEPTCEQGGCGKSHYARGMCKPHYRADYYRRNKERENANSRAYRADLHFDHVIPVSRGGAHSMDNIKSAHAVCNLRKHDKLIAELDWLITG